MLLSDVCLSRTSGLTREQKGIGRLKLAQPTSHVTRTPLSMSKGQGHQAALVGCHHLQAWAGHIVAAARLQLVKTDKRHPIIVEKMISNQINQIVRFTNNNVKHRVQNKAKHVNSSRE